MPYDLYWDGPLDAYFHYMEKARIEYDLEKKKMDLNCWLTGLYTRDAVLSIYHALNPMAGKNAKEFPYPEKPRMILEEEKKKKTDEQKRVEVYNEISAWMSRFKSRKKPDEGVE